MVTEERKVFKENHVYYINIIIKIIGIIAAIWLIIWLQCKSQQEIIELFSEQKLIGTGRQRGSRALQSFLVNKWGKTGILSIPIIGFILLLKSTANIIFEYIRYINKMKLYKRGLVNNLDDDYQSVNLFISIKNIIVSKFTKKQKKNYPSKKNMKRIIENNKYLNHKKE